MKTLKLAAALTCVLATVLSVLVAPEAKAAPAPTAYKPVPQYVELNLSQTKAVKLVSSARLTAMSKHGATMDYRKMIRIFGKNVDWRRQMAAGVRQVGTRIEHISAAESRVVNAYRAKYIRHVCWQCKRVQRLDPPANSCGQGRSGWEHLAKKLDGQWTDVQYFNSCETQIMLANRSTCVIWASLVTGLMELAPVPVVHVKVAGIIPGVIAAMCGTRREYLSAAAANSKLGAVKMYSGYLKAHNRFGAGLGINSEWLPQ